MTSYGYFQNRAKRLRLDRRIHYGNWYLHQKRRHKADFDENGKFRVVELPASEQEWLFLSYGEIKFPTGLDFQQLRRIGVRRGIHAKHPKTGERLIDTNPDFEITTNPQYYFQRDAETNYVAHLVSIKFDIDYLIKVELEIDHIICPAVQTMLQTIPEWDRREILNYSTDGVSS